MANSPIHQREAGFQAAIDGITEGFSTLVRKHFELARTEVRQEASHIGQHLGALAVFATIALVGYGLLNLAIVLLVGWLAGAGPMAFTCLFLAILNLGIAAVAIGRILKDLRNHDVGLSQTTEELQRNKKWLKGIRSNSPEKLPAKTN